MSFTNSKVPDRVTTVRLCGADPGPGQRQVRRCYDPYQPAELDRLDKPATRETGERALGILKRLKGKKI